LKRRRRHKRRSLIRVTVTRTELRVHGHSTDHVICAFVSALMHVVCRRASTFQHNKPPKGSLTVVPLKQKRRPEIVREVCRVLAALAVDFPNHVKFNVR